MTYNISSSECLGKPLIRDSRFDRLPLKAGNSGTADPLHPEA